MAGTYGDWKNLERILSQAGDNLKRNCRAATDKNGRLLQSGMVERIEQQKIKPLLSSDSKHAKRKAKNGFSPLTLVQTAQLISRGINYKRIDDYSGMVTVRRMVGGVNIAGVHEFGSAKMKIPARPFAGPTCGEKSSEVIRNYEEAIEKTFRGNR